MTGRSDLHDHRPHRQIRHKMAVHNVDVDAVGAGLFGFADLFAKTGEIGGQDGRGQFDIEIAHGSAFLRSGVMVRRADA